MRIRVTAPLFLLLVVAGCAAASGGSSEPRRNRNVLTETEMSSLLQFTAWEAVQRLRPMWMRPGGVRNSANPSGQYPHVFVDGAPYGDMEVLQTLRVLHIKEMRYISSTDATIRYGGEYGGGVILVTMQGTGP